MDADAERRFAAAPANAGAVAKHRGDLPVDVVEQARAGLAAAEHAARRERWRDRRHALWAAQVRPHAELNAVDLCLAGNRGNALARHDDRRTLLWPRQR